LVNLKPRSAILGPDSRPIEQAQIFGLGEVGLVANTGTLVARSYRRSCDRIVIRIVEVVPARESRFCGQGRLSGGNAITFNSRAVTDRAPASDREAAICQNIDHSVWRGFGCTVPLPASRLSWQPSWQLR
jgi:hypothetical protein